MSSEFICAAARAHVTERCGYWLLAAQQPINRPGWWKGKFTLFQIWATGGWTSVQRRTPLPANDGQWTRAVIGWGRELHGETAQSALTVIFKLVIGGLTSRILIILSTVSLFSFSVGLIPFPWGQFSELWQLMSWLQPGHHVVNLSTWCRGFSIYKTAHRTWLRISSITLEKELKVLDCA